jgi:CheY-like chemotaxis protein
MSVTRLAGVLEPGPSRTSLRILIVEDEVQQAASLAALLQHAGHDVALANNGPLAVASAAAGPDVVLLDLRLPGLDGQEVARAIRNLGLPRLPALVGLTGGHSDEFDRLRPSEDGVHICLRKPTDPAFLLRIIDRMTALIRPHLAGASLIA